MAKSRKKIPKEIEAEILFRNNRTCCICRDSTKGVQIHHIDENPSNNEESNLAVVCVDHQDEIHKLGGITKGISPILVKKFKSSWELEVRKSRTREHTPLKSELGIEKTLFEFEIRKSAYEILALEDSDIKAITQRLNFLFNLYLMEDYTEQILEALRDIVVIVAMSDKNKSCLIADNIIKYSSHLVGPENVKIRKEDPHNLETTIETIGTIGEFSASFNRSYKVIKSVLKVFEDIWNRLIWYDLEGHALMVLDKLDDILSGCEIPTIDEKPFDSGIVPITNSFKRLKTVTIEQRPKWGKVLARLDRHFVEK